MNLSKKNIIHCLIVVYGRRLVIFTELTFILTHIRLDIRLEVRLGFWVRVPDAGPGWTRPGEAAGALTRL